MILTILFIVFSHTLNAEPIKQAAEWHACLQSYQQAKTAFFDVTYGETTDKNQLIFRNGKFLPPQLLYIFNNGKFWTAELPIGDNFYQKKVAIVTIGAEKFCLKYEFNLIRKDDLVISPFKESTCATPENIVMNVAQAEAHPSIEDVMFRKMKNDIMWELGCIADRQDKTCGTGRRTREYDRLTKWNTLACEKIANIDLKRLIADKKRILSDYSSEASPPATSIKKKRPTSIN